MLPNAWRILKAKHAATAFSGEGAAKTGGRWNSRGVRVIYTSHTQSLAALEILVHLNPPVPSLRFVAIPIRFDAVKHKGLVEIYPAQSLPEDWRSEPPPPSAKAVGDAWVKEARSVILQLPSVIIPAEWNYLLNPSHPDFKRIVIGKPQPFSFDPRLVP